MKFSFKDFFSKCDQIHKKLRIWSHLQNKSLMENFIFCAVWSKKNSSVRKLWVVWLEIYQRDVFENENVKQNLWKMPRKEFYYCQLHTRNNEIMQILNSTQAQCLKTSTVFLTLKGLFFRHKDKFFKRTVLQSYWK